MDLNVTAKLEAQRFSISKCTDTIFLQISMIQILCLFLSCFIFIINVDNAYCLQLTNCFPRQQGHPHLIDEDLCSY